METAYKLDDLVKACGVKGKTRVLVGAKESAHYFNLYTEESILRFIHKGGLESPNYIRKKPWEKNPSPIKIMVDSYSFYSGKKFGYLAFLYSPITKKWIIKSFKKNTEDGPKNFEFANKLFLAITKKSQEIDEGKK